MTTTNVTQQFYTTCSFVCVRWESVNSGLLFLQSCPRKHEGKKRGRGSCHVHVRSCNWRRPECFYPFCLFLKKGTQTRSLHAAPSLQSFSSVYLPFSFHLSKEITNGEKEEHFVSGAARSFQQSVTLASLLLSSALLMASFLLLLLSPVFLFNNSSPFVSCTRLKRTVVGTRFVPFFCSRDEQSGQSSSIYRWRVLLQQHDR